MGSKRLFLVGESYTGMYVPSIARRIYLENQKHGSKQFPLAGIALGNGWMDAKIQGPATIDFAYWHGMLDIHTRDSVHEEWDHCMRNNNVSSHFRSKELNPFHPFNVPDDCGMLEGVLEAAGAGRLPTNEAGPNSYDITTWDAYDVIKSGINSTFDRVYNDPCTKRALHAPVDVEWRVCVVFVGRRRRQLEQNQDERQLYLEDDRPISVIPYIAEMLDDAMVSKY